MTKDLPHQHADPFSSHLSRLCHQHQIFISHDFEAPANLTEVCAGFTFENCQEILSITEISGQRHWFGCGFKLSVSRCHELWRELVSLLPRHDGNSLSSFRPFQMV